MLVISHRGNVIGPRPGTENKRDTILDVIERLKIPVEIDIRVKSDIIYLGHDFATESVTPEFLVTNKHMLYIHAKNPETAGYLKDKQWGLNWFFHDQDKLVLTSKGDLWCFPGVYLPNGITVVLGKKPLTATPPTYGICTDYPLSWIGLK